MKKFIFLILAIISLSFAESYAVDWLQKADFGGGRIFDATSFVIGNYGYVATGRNDVYEYPYGGSAQRFMYRYNPSLDVWKRMADLPPAAGATFHAVGFTIGEKGYVCGGADNATLWEYDPATNLWYKRINLPRVIEEGIGFAISSKAYVGLGGASSIEYKNDFYEYDPSKNKWTQLNDFPGTPRRGSIGFSMNGKGYAGLGYKQIGSYDHGYFKDLWEYNPLTDDWTRLPDFPGEGREDAIGFGIDGTIYVGMGEINDFYKYDLKTKEWSTLNYIPGNIRYWAFSFCIGSGIYYGGGLGGFSQNDMWEYDAGIGTNVENYSIEKIKLYPEPAHDYILIPNITEDSNSEIIDIYGNTVISVGSGEKKIDISNLPSGTYFLRFTDINKRTNIGKFIKL